MLKNRAQYITYRPIRLVSLLSSRIQEIPTIWSAVFSFPVKEGYIVIP